MSMMTFSVRRNWFGRRENEKGSIAEKPESKEEKDVSYDELGAS